MDAFEIILSGDRFQIIFAYWHKKNKYLYVLKVALSQKRLEDFYISKINIPNPYPELFTDLGGKFKFSAQDSDLEYLFWRCKNPPVSSDLQPPLALGQSYTYQVL